MEAQFLDPIAPDDRPRRSPRMFTPYLDPTRTPRETAIAWAIEERKALEKN